METLILVVRRAYCLNGIHSCPFHKATSLRNKIEKGESTVRHCREQQRVGRKHKPIRLAVSYVVLALAARPDGDLPD